MRCTPPKLRWFKELRDLNPATNCKLGYALCARCERCRVSLTVTFVQSENPRPAGDPSVTGGCPISYTLFPSMPLSLRQCSDDWCPGFGRSGALEFRHILDE